MKAKQHDITQIVQSIDSVFYAVIFLLLLCQSLTVGAVNKAMTKKVNQDLAQYKVFESLTVASEINHSSYVTIGADASCDFNSAVDSIQAAIDSGAEEVRVASNGTYQNNLRVENKSIVIRGGFVDCVAAHANQQVYNDLTVIDGSAAAEPVIYFAGSVITQQSSLENLKLTGGTSIAPHFGGGVSVELASLKLYLLRVIIEDNSGVSGAGIMINSGLDEEAVETSIIGRDVLITNNMSISVGGGIHCVGRANLILNGMSLISNNQANIGGGVALRHGCSLSMYSENFTDSLNSIAGLYKNQSQSNGGGAYLFNGSNLYMFGQRMCGETGCMGSGKVAVTVRNNSAGLSPFLEGNGGGFYLAQSGEQNFFYANGLIMYDNSARENGGAGFLSTNAQVIIERQLGACWNQDRCNSIIANSSGTESGAGGAFYVLNRGELTIKQSYLQLNRADHGTAVFADGEEAEVYIESSIFSDNGDEGSDDFSDIGVVSAFNGASIDIKHSTLVDNNLTSSVFNVGESDESSLKILNSIVHDPSSGNLFGPDNGLLDVSCVITHEDTSFNGDQVVVIDPDFVDRTGNDFHLKPESFAIDMCADVIMSQPLDVDADIVGWDDPTKLNLAGPFDAGADETYINDVIFIDGF